VTRCAAGDPRVLVLLEQMGMQSSARLPWAWALLVIALMAGTLPSRASDDAPADPTPGFSPFILVDYPPAGHAFTPDDQAYLVVHAYHVDKAEPDWKARMQVCRPAVSSL
jgi:hypothetical protein